MSSRRCSSRRHRNRSETDPAVGRKQFDLPRRQGRRCPGGGRMPIPLGIRRRPQRARLVLRQEGSVRRRHGVAPMRRRFDAVSSVSYAGPLAGSVRQSWRNLLPELSLYGRSGPCQPDPAVRKTGQISPASRPGQRNGRRVPVPPGPFRFFPSVLEGDHNFWSSGLRNHGPPNPFYG